MQIHQLLASAHEGDATGDAARALATRLSADGHDAGVFALHVDESLRGAVGRIDDLPDAGPDDATMLHFNIPSPLADLLRSRAGRRMICYHNLTPPQLLLPHCPDLARLTALGRQQLQELAAAGTVDLAIGVSAYNTRDLRETGFSSTATVPLPIDLGRLSGPTNPVLEAELAANPLPTFITVGRVAPNKRIEDFIKTAAYYLRYISPQARFLVIGSTRGLESYVDALIELHGDLKLDDRVNFVNHVSLADLTTYYRHASAYVCTSAHEGFCAPLLEAMTLGVPIVARRAAAVPETLSNAGIMVDSEDPAAWAEILHAVISDDALRDRLVGLGAERVRYFDSTRVLDQWVATLTPGDRRTSSSAAAALETEPGL